MSMVFVLYLSLINFLNYHVVKHMHLKLSCSETYASHQRGMRSCVSRQTTSTHRWTSASSSPHCVGQAAAALTQLMATPASVMMVSPSTQ